MNGKGDKPRPLSVDQKTFDSNWDKIFNKNVSIPANMWEHNCKYNGPHCCWKGKSCNWCGMKEDGSFD